MSEQGDLPLRQPDLTAAKRALLVKWQRGEFAGASQVETIPHRRVASPVPMSFAQQRLWFLDQLVPNNTAYTIYCAFYLHGVLDIHALERSLSTIVRRHESLRTIFTSVDEQPVQVILPTLSIPLSPESLEQLPEDERELAASRLAQEEIARPFDLATGPLLRTRLLRLNQEKHALIVTMHHSISDGWSIGVFLRELATLYAAFHAGRPSPLPDLPIQYADFALWQRREGNPLAAQLAYWQRTLNGAPALLELPLDHPRPPVQSFHGATSIFALPLELVQQLKLLAQREQVTLFQVLLAAFYILLARYSGQEDIVIGTPIAGRVRTETEPLIGFFANTLALRADLSGDPGIQEVLKRVRAMALEAYAHQDLPFEQVVEALHPEREMSYHPLFQTMFVLQSEPLERPEFADLSLSPLAVEDRTSLFDLWLSLQEHEQGATATLGYKSELFERSTIERLCGHYRRILEACVADPQQHLSQISLLAARQRSQVLYEWNATDVAYPPHLCLHTLVEEQARCSPQAPAVSYDGRCLTYRELDQRAEHLARVLRRLGVGPEVLVGVCMRRSLEMVVALLGILKAGGAYVPLDPDYPRERLAFMVADTHVPVVLTQQHLQALTAGLATTVLRLDAEMQPWEDEDTSARDYSAVPVQPDHLAYVIYTSGSTGQPKGAMLTHRGICNRLLWMQDRYHLTPADRVLQKTPFSFDVSVWEFFWPLLAGACLVMARPDGHRDSAYLVDLIAREQITTLHFVPSMLDLFLQEPGLERCSCLKRVLCSGEALPYEYQQRFHTLLGAELHNLYGPTEASIDVTAWQCHPASERRSVPIGRPIANTRIYLLDRALNPVPVGAPGELYIGGVGLARGYLRRADLTAQHFLPDPWSGEPGARLYRTGDLARYRPDGAIEFLGRIDTQVKLRGVRIEPGEIEATLRQHPAVHDALVAAREGQAGEKKLVAYVIPTSAAQDQGKVDLDEHEIVDHWRQVFDTAYQDGSRREETFPGWNSSDTGLPLPSDEMREWVERTVERILALRPRRVLEIGCGTGLLLTRIVPHCEYYCGTDISAEGLSSLRQQLAGSPDEQRRVELRQRRADDFSDMEPRSFDTIILNSVVQYFPHLAYVEQVLEGALPLLAPGGTIFIGDVRSLPLLETFHTSVQWQRAASSLSTTHLRQRIQRAVAQENELLIDPAFFFTLKERFPSLKGVEVQIKRGSYHNELTQFRYDVTLYTGSEPPPTEIVEPIWLDWQAQHLTLADLRHLLEKHRPAVLGLCHIPNARLLDALHVESLLAHEPEQSATVGEMRAALQQGSPQQGVEPESLWAMEQEYPYTVSICWSEPGHKGCFDVLLQSRSRTSPAAQAWQVPMPLSGRQRQTEEQNYASNPLWNQWMKRLLPGLRDYLRKRLPEYMVPTAFVGLPALPLSPNGKVDRRALPDPPPPLADPEADQAAPRSKAEETLTRIWQEVLGLEQIGLHTNFFEAGGDSIQSIRVVARAARAGLRLNTRQLFQHQTIAQLASVATPIPIDQPETQAASSACASRPQSSGGELLADAALWQRIQENMPEAEDAYPLTPFQQHMLNYQLGTPQPGVYVVHQISFLQEEHVDTGALERAWQQVINRHAALRTSFLWCDLPQPVQIVHRQVPIRFERLDWRGLAADQQDALAREYVKAQRERGFDLAKAPQSQFTLMRCDEQIYRFFWSFNYMLQDGWSYPLIVREFFALYEAYRQGNELALDESLRYRDFIAWLQAQDQQGARAFWTRTLQGWTTPTPLQRYAPDNQAGTQSGYTSQEHSLPGSLTTALRALARQHQLTLNTLLQGCWALLLHLYTGEDDVLFGGVVSGRPASLPGVEYIVGLFNNILPVRVRLQPDQPLLAWLTELQAQQIEARQYEYSSPTQVQTWLGLPGDFPLYESYLVFENFPLDTAVMDRLRNWTRGHSALTQTEHPLRVEIWPQRSLIFSLCYYRAIFADATITQMLHDIQQVLEAFVQQPRARLSDLQRQLAPLRGLAGRLDRNGSEPQRPHQTLENAPGREYGN